MSCPVTVCKATLRFPTARKGISHVKQRRSEAKQAKKKRKRKKKNGEFGLNSFVDGLYSSLHNDGPYVSDHSGADLGSGADPGPARVPGHQ